MGTGPVTPFHYATYPAAIVCAGCAAENSVATTKSYAETEVGPLKVCGGHVDWALRKLGLIKEKDVD